MVPMLLVHDVVKFMTSPAYFMHLKYDTALFSCLFYTGLGARRCSVLVAVLTFHFCDQLTPDQSTSEMLAQLAAANPLRFQLHPEVWCSSVSSPARTSTWSG